MIKTPFLTNFDWSVESFKHIFSPLGTGKSKHGCKRRSQDMPRRRCQKTRKSDPSKSFKIMLPYTRQHNFHGEKWSLNNTLLSTFWTPVLAQGIHFECHGPFYTGLVFCLKLGPAKSAPAKGTPHGGRGGYKDVPGRGSLVIYIYMHFHI